MGTLRQVNAWEIMPVLLLLLFSIALSVGVGLIAVVIRRAREKSAGMPAEDAGPACPYERACWLRRPGCWLAVKSRNLQAVQSALGLHNPKPCTWLEGLDEKLFIAPPVKGWILVLGSGLPDPSDDVDACFRFVLDLSRKLGQVQYFSVNGLLHYHAWVKADRGRVQRAYAWAGRTVWQQGARTAAEKELDLKCFAYADTPEPPGFGQANPMALNADRVPQLAARWSLDPARIDRRCFELERGIAGELAKRY